MISFLIENGFADCEKSAIAIEADDALQRYFEAHEAEVESWFNVIAPSGGTLELLQGNLRDLSQKLSA